MTDLKRGGPDCSSRPVVYLSGLALGEEHHELMIVHSTMHSSIAIRATSCASSVSSSLRVAGYFLQADLSVAILTMQFCLRGETDTDLGTHLRGIRAGFQRRRSRFESRRYPSPHSTSLAPMHSVPLDLIRQGDSVLRPEVHP